MTNQNLDELFKQRLEAVGRGREAFLLSFSDREISIDDRFILVLTKQQELLSQASRCIPEFRNKVIGNLYVISDEYLEGALEDEMVYCDKQTVSDIALYLAIMPQKTARSDTYVFITDHDGYGVKIQEYLGKGMLTVEQYVRIGLFDLI